MENKYFKIAGDLDERTEQKTNYFQPAGDLEENEISFINDNTENDIKNYLVEILSGERLRESEGLRIIGAGSMIVSFNYLQKMVHEDCYNFIQAEYLNPEMIIVEYEKYQKEEIKTK